MPAINMEIERAAIQRTAAAQAEATNKGGIEGARGYAVGATADARWLPPESPAITGREAIAQYASAYTEMRGFHMTWDHPHVVVAASGDIAYSIGTYNGGAEDPSGKVQSFAGKLLNVWHKQPDGSWQVAAAMWNTNEPPTAGQA